MTFSVTRAADEMAVAARLELAMPTSEPAALAT